MTDRIIHIREEEEALGTVNDYNQPTRARCYQLHYCFYYLSSR